MAKFCKKCGSKLDEASGKCPNCDKLADEQNTSSNNAPEQQKQLSKKELKVEKKKLKKQAKKDKKKQKRAQLTTKQKVKRFFVKFIAVILALIIAMSGCACALVYFDLMDIPFVSDVMSKIGITQKDGEADDFNSITGKFTDILVTDEQSAIAAAQEAALQMGLGNAADELTVNNVSTVEDLTYYRLQQNYQGIPVYERSITVVVDNEGNTINATSTLSSIDFHLSSSRKNKDEIEKSIYNYVKTELDILKNQQIVLGNIEEDNLIIVFSNETWLLCYNLALFVGDYSMYKVIVDAVSAEIIQFTSNTNTIMADAYNGDRSISVECSFDEESNDYSLYDENRHITIWSLNGTNSHDGFSNSVPITSNNDIFGDTDNEKNLRYDDAVKLFYNTTKIYDYYSGEFNMSTPYSEILACYDDMYDSGKNALGGTLDTSDGDQIGFISMGRETGVDCIDIITHEYSHMISRKYVGWTEKYSIMDETLAVNEAFSDIMGILGERKITGETDWCVSNIRNISDPHATGNPNSATDKLYTKALQLLGDAANFMIFWEDTGKLYDGHYFSTVISHAAYLMSTGVNNQYIALSFEELEELWVRAMLTFPETCSFDDCRDCLEIAAQAIGLNNEKIECVNAAFDSVGIKGNRNNTLDYSTESTLSVIDCNGDSYDDYTIKITGKKYRGFIKTGLWKEDYNNEISVSDSNPVSLNLTRGDYTITVTDNFDSSNSVSKSVKIRGGSKNKELVMATSFGFDYVINPSSRLTVYDMNNQLYDNYSVKIDGTYTDDDGVKQSYSDDLTSNTSEPTAISLNEGKYSFLLKDGLDNSKTKSFTVRVRSVGSTDFKIYTAFGKKVGQYDKSDVPKDAVEYNGHYYYIFTDEKSWYDADDFCKSQNGYLATITSSEEQQFVQQYVQKAKKSLTNNDNETWNKELWIGANDLDFEGIWEWSNGESITYTNWGNNQPDDSAGQDYGALLSFLREGNGYRINEGQWDDTDSYRCPFICEWGEYTPESAEKEISSQPKRETSDERDIVLVLDVSGSMSGTPLEETKKAATKFINTILKEDASIGIVVYDDNAEVLSDFSMDEEKLTGIVSGITDRGSTNIDDGLTKANELLQYSNAEKKIIVLMSDGMPNCGREGDDLIAFADSIKDTGTYIYTLGFFESVGGSKSSAQLLMEGIASDGCHYEVADADDLVFFFGDIADQINGQKFIYVRIACPVDVTVTYLGESLSSSEKDFNDRTSFGALSLEDIEDSDDKIKTLRLKEGKDYAIKINGTGRGKMDYTIGYMDDNGEYSDMRNFRNIDITRSTVIDTSTKYSDKTILNVDEDGDGKYDLKFRAGANEYGELVDYTYVIYIALAVVGAITILIAVVVIRRKIKKRKVA